MKNSKTHIMVLSLFLCAIQALSCATPRARLKMDIGFRYNLESEGLRGRVRESKKISQGWVYHNSFDIHGNIIRQHEYDSRKKDGTVTEHKNEYDGAGRLKRRAVYTKGILEDLYEYNRYGDITLREYSFDSGKTRIRLFYREGPPPLTRVTVEEQSLDDTGRVESVKKTVEHYDRGHCVKKDHYYPDGNIRESEPVVTGIDIKGNATARQNGSGMESFEYDELGRLVSSRRTEHAGVYGHNEKFSYGPKGFISGKLVEETGPYGRMIRRYSYNTEGLLLDVRTNSAVTERYSHDAAGNVIEKKFIDDGREISAKYEYEYWQ